MATFAVVPGLWHDPHAWFDCARQLRGSGHKVHLIPVHGHGKRPKADVSHRQCVDSICVYFRTCQLCDVVLVGHTCSALWALDAAARMPRGVVRRLVLDSPLLPPVRGGAVVDVLPKEIQDLFLGKTAQQGAASCVNPPTELLRRYVTWGLSDALGERFRVHFARAQSSSPMTSIVDPRRLAPRDTPIVIFDSPGDPLRGFDAAPSVATAVEASIGVDMRLVEVLPGIGGSLAFLSSPREYARLLVSTVERPQGARLGAGIDPSRIWPDWAPYESSVSEWVDLA